MVKTVGMIGVGQMGRGMVRNLVQKGFEVRAYDVSEQALATARSMGALPTRSPSEAAAGSDAVVLSLPAPEVVREIVLGDEGVLQTLEAGSVIVDTSTIDPDTARQLAAQAAERHVAYLDAPVSGGPPGAEAGTLTIMVGGDRAAFEYVEPVLRAMGTDIYHVGDSGNGQAAKLCHNMVVSVTTVILAEALLTGSKAGIDPALLAEIMSRGVARSGTLELFGRNLTRGTYDDLIVRLAIMEKDLHLFLKLAESLDVPTLLPQPAHQLYRAARLNGKGDLDQTVVCQVLEAMAAWRIAGGRTSDAAGGPASDGARNPSPGASGGPASAGTGSPTGR